MEASVGASELNTAGGAPGGALPIFETSPSTIICHLCTTDRASDRSLACALFLFWVLTPMKAHTATALTVRPAMSPRISTIGRRRKNGGFTSTGTGLGGLATLGLVFAFVFPLIATGSYLFMRRLTM